jgi:hypothetical protein
MLTLGARYDRNCRPIEAGMPLQKIDHHPANGRYVSGGLFASHLADECNRLFSSVDLGGTIDHNLSSDLKRHQVFAHFQRT